MKRPVAGIAMGLILEGKDFAVLSDILGDEDHLGDMDFKVAGTSEGITSLQMDIKVAGITEEIMKVALAQAKDGRAHILGEMAKALDHTREELRAHAPRIETMTDPQGQDPRSHRHRRQDHPRDRRHHRRQGRHRRRGRDQDLVLRPRPDRGRAGVDPRHRRRARCPGTIYTGKVANIVDFGAFVTFMPGKDGLVHVSEIRNERVENVRDVLTEGQEVKVKLLEVDSAARSACRCASSTRKPAPSSRTPVPRASRVKAATVRRGGDRDRGPRRDGGGDRGRGPRREGGGGGGRDGGRGRDDRGPRGPRREGGPAKEEGPAPEFAPAFLNRDED